MKFFLTLALIVTSNLLHACCMLPIGYGGQIAQNSHEGIVIHDGDREELILRIQYQITGETMPAQFAWVVTVPNEPDSYSVVESNVFRDLRMAVSLVGSRKGLGGGGGSFGEPRISGVVLGKPAKVGPYDIQPVKGVGKDALKGLNLWLTSNGFPIEEPNHMAYFVKNGFTFLCIKVSPSEGSDGVDSTGMLKPLHLSIKSDKPYYPLRFSSRQGTFGLNLQVLTKQELNYQSSRLILRRIQWSNHDEQRNVKVTTSKLPKSLKELIDKSKLKNSKKSWHYNYLEGEEINKRGEIAQWKSDVFFNGMPKRHRTGQLKPAVYK